MSKQPLWLERWANIAEKIRIINNPQEEQALLDSLAGGSQMTTVMFVNAHAMNLLAQDENLYNALMAADVLLRDGSGMSMLYKRLGRDPGLNMNGTDFIPKTMRTLVGRKTAFWGTEEPYLSRSVKRCADDFGLEVQSLHQGFENVTFYLDLAKQEQPEFIVLGMGMPKQETIARLIKEQYELPCVLVCGGAILDFLGEKVVRAPLWMQHTGIEWLFRLLQEPKRLFKRYVIGNAVFLYRAKILQKELKKAG